MEKEIKVRLHSELNGEYLEIWKILGNDEYIGRRNYGRGEWVYLCDAPCGYCEVSHSLENDIEIIVCDRDGNELLRDGNDYGEYGGFSSFNQRGKSEWSSIRDNYPVTRDGFGKWIDNFMPEKIDYTDKINWNQFRQDVIEEEILHTYTHLGVEKKIIRQKNKHQLCSAEWFEYFICNKVMDKYDNYDMFLGYEFPAVPAAQNRL